MLDFQVVENKYCRRYQQILKPKAKLLNHKSTLDELRKIEKLHRAKMETMLEGQNMVMTHDSWTDSGNRTYFSATYTFITEEWELIAISPNCTKHAGTATGEDLAKLVEGVIYQHGHRDMITAVVTDCEPAMVKAGRILSRNKVTEHIGCAGHRLQSSVGVGFTGGGR